MNCVTIITFYAYVVIFIDYGFCIITFVSKFLAGGYAFSCIRPMLNFLKLRDVSHKGTMVKPKASWKGLDREFCCPVTCEKFCNIVVWLINLNIIWSINMIILSYISFVVSYAM